MTRETCPSSTPELAPFPRLRSSARQGAESHRESTLAEQDFEDVAAEWILVAVWTAIAYYGITLTGLAWYWPVGVGLVVGLAAYKLLSGPLRVFLSGLKRSSLLIATLGTIVMFVMQVSA